MKNLIYLSGISFAGLFILISVIVPVENANILFFFGMVSYSHRIGIWPLVESLAAKGHNITFLSRYPCKNPNPKVTEYVPKSLTNWIDSINSTSTMYGHRGGSKIDYDWYKIDKYGYDMCAALLDDQEFVKWAQTSHFDLIFVNALVNECAYGLAYQFKAKIIVFNTANPFPWYYDPFGFPDESSTIPDMILHFPPNNLSFFQRLLNLLNPLYFYYLREVKYFPKLEKLLREKLVPDLPPISEIERNVSLFMVNHHYAEDFARPLPPNVISVGGLHITTKNTQQLPKELEDFIAKGNDEGFIYMSFGSKVEITNFPKKVQNVFVNTLKKLKNIQVIWKTNMERPKDLPDNIYVEKWMPQQAILGHSKIRGFITHGGLLGIHEAIAAAVPLIVFPVFAEQDYNADKISYRETGIQLEIMDVTVDQLLDAIKTLTTDQKYTKNMKKLSKQFVDRPMSALDTALWWTEYVLKNDDTTELRPASVYQSWWKKRQLDIWASIIISILIALKIIYSIVKMVFKCIINLCGKSKSLKPVMKLKKK